MIIAHVDHLGYLYCPDCTSGGYPQHDDNSAMLGETCDNCKKHFGTPVGSRMPRWTSKPILETIWKGVIMTNQEMDNMNEHLLKIVLAAELGCACDWDSINYILNTGVCNESTWDICRN